MDPTLATVLGVFMRWVHIISVVILIGGLFYARGIGTTISPWFRPKIWIGLGGILVSGTYNLLTKSSVPPMYHMWFGIKMLLALHIFAVLVLLANKNSNPAKHGRWITGVLVSGTVVITLSAYLRWLTLSPVVKLP